MGRSRSHRGRGRRVHRGGHSGHGGHGGQGGHGGGAARDRRPDVNPLQPAIDYAGLPRDDDAGFPATGVLDPDLLMPAGAGAEDAPAEEAEAEAPKKGRSRAKKGTKTASRSKKAAASSAVSDDEEAESDGASEPPPSALPAKISAALRKSGAISIASIEQLPLPELLELCEKEGVELVDTTKKAAIAGALARVRLKKHGLLLAEGCLEILSDGFGFLRPAYADYLPNIDDVFVSQAMIHKHGLKTGHMITGAVRPQKENEKYLALARVDTVNGGDPMGAVGRTAFEELTPLYPDRRMVLETTKAVIETRIIDLVAPIGRGQRGLIVSPPRAGKTVLLQKIANAITANSPDVHLIVLLVDERPEEVTDMERSIRGEVIASTFDEPASRHVQVAQMVLQKAKRMVEFGLDVVILLDSITRLARAHNTEAPQSGKILSGGIDAGALQKPKQFFGAARNIEEGGSLTILGTTLVDTGSRMDEVIFEEFKGTGNMEIVLDRRLADRRIFPAVDVNASGTRREDLLIDGDELRRVWLLRRFMNDITDPVEAMDLLVEKMGKTTTNAEFLMSMNLE